MQNRMKNHQLTEVEINELLEKAEIGSLATLNLDGSPYIIPIHFIYYNSKIYAHGLPKGKKIDNIINDSRVSFCAYEMENLLLDPNGEPCETNTKYKSVIISGESNIIEDLELKNNILREIVKKYTPQLVDNEIPDSMVKGTAVIRIDILSITGKYYE